MTMNGRAIFLVSSMLIAAAVLLSACGSSSGGTAQATASPSAASTPLVTPSPTPSPLTCTSSGAASSSWPGTSRTSTTPPIVSATASGDTFTLTFDQGTPQFAIQTQSGTHFVKDPSGMAIDLAGSAGATIVLRGFRGDMGNYTGAASLDTPPHARRPQSEKTAARGAMGEVFM